jgi:hypothetical protein
MQLKRPGSQPSAKGPEEYFAGNVRVDMLNIAPAPSRVLRQRHIRTRCPLCLAHASIGTDADSHIWLRLDSVRR